jgi:hypothetical protein
MPEPFPEQCPACASKGWVLCNTGNDKSPRYEIQRCDACEAFDGDQAALTVVVNAAQAQPQLLGFVQNVSLLTHEGEEGLDGNPFETTSEDYIATLNQLILEARKLLGTAEKCGDCGETVPYLIGCPDGIEICRQCFDAGQH